MTRVSVGIWTGQGAHAFLLVLLLAAVGLARYATGPLEGAWAGISADVWLYCAVATPVVHQVYVWLCWRLELRNRAVTRSLGFRPYMVLFMILFGCRFVTLAALAWSNHGSMVLPTAGWAVALVITRLPAAYAGYSVVRYFGIPRAVGADHFDEQYRTMPLVDKGIFRFTSNGMYLYAFLAFWTIAIGFASVGALMATGFSHAYIWVHYACTERPDMQAMYAPTSISVAVDVPTTER